MGREKGGTARVKARYIFSSGSNKLIKIKNFKKERKMKRGSLLLPPPLLHLGSYCDLLEDGI